MAFTPNYSCLGKDKTLRFSETVDELILSDTGVTNNDTDLPSQQSPEIPDVNERLGKCFLTRFAHDLHLYSYMSF